MRKNKKNSIDWLANRSDARDLIPLLGARNIAVVEAVVLHFPDKEEVIGSYDKMVQHNDPEATKKLMEWMGEFPVHHPDYDHRYVYFRIKTLR